MYAKAQRILHSQLLDKQKQLQTVIQCQKAQLTRIQEQIILNAQAQFSLQDVGNLESTKQLQQQVYDLETERKQHETRQKELRSMFQQKLNRLPAYKNNERLHSVMTFQHISSPESDTAHDIKNKENYLARNSSTLSEANISVPRNTAQKSRFESSESCSQEQHAQPPSSSSLFGENSGDETYAKGKCYGHCASTSSVSSQQKNNNLSFSERRTIPANTSGGCAVLSGNQAKDYFSKFSSNELEVFLSSTASSSNDHRSDDVGKDEVTEPSTYDSLLRQQKRLLEMQEVSYHNLRLL